MSPSIRAGQNSRDPEVNRVVTTHSKQRGAVLFNQHHIDHYREIRDVIKPGTRFEERLRVAIDRGLILLPNDQDTETFIAERFALHRRAGGTRMIRRHTNGRTLGRSFSRVRGFQATPR